MRPELWCGCVASARQSCTSAKRPARSCRAPGDSGRNPTVREGAPRYPKVEVYSAPAPSLTVGFLTNVGLRYISRVQRERIDKILVDRGLAESRTKAQALVMSASVLVDEQLVSKPSEKFSPAANIRIKTRGDASGYVGRGGLKLE